MDKWGQNPEILMMRKIFKQLEAAQDELLAKLEVSVFDPRLPRWRQRARVLFEQYWYQYLQTTGERDEMQAGVVYSHCLARVMVADGLQLPDDMLSADEQIVKLFNEDGS